MSGIPVGLVIKDLLGFGGLVATVVSGSIWLGAINARVTALEDGAQGRSGEGERLARLETLVGAINEGIKEIRHDVRRQGTGKRRNIDAPD